MRPLDAKNLLKINQELQDKDLNGSIFEHYPQSLVIQNQIAIDVLKELIAESEK